MPRMDGYEVAEIITGYSKSKDIPIIFLSAVNIDKRFITKGYTSGGVDYVTKPFTLEELMARINVRFRQNAANDTIKKNRLRIIVSSLFYFFSTIQDIYSKFSAASNRTMHSPFFARVTHQKAGKLFYHRGWQTKGDQFPVRNNVSR